MKRYTIDLSMPPKMRWNHVLSDYNSSVPLVIKYFQSEVCHRYTFIVLCTIKNTDKADKMACHAPTDTFQSCTTSVGEDHGKF